MRQLRVANGKALSAARAGPDLPWSLTPRFSRTEDVRGPIGLASRTAKATNPGANLTERKRGGVPGELVSCQLYKSTQYLEGTSTSCRTLLSGVFFGHLGRVPFGFPNARST